MKNCNDFDFDLNIDSDLYKSRGDESILEKDTKVLRNYKNRLGINSLRFDNETASIDAKLVTNISFNILALPHPECSFEWIRLIVNFSSIPDSIIEDFIPKNEKGDQPIKYVVSEEKGLTFEATSIKLGPSYTRKEEIEHNVFFERILSAGIKTKQVNWDFYQQEKTKLHLDNMMKIKLSHNLKNSKLNPEFKIEAKIRINGWKGLIPIYGSKIF